jgi:DNA-binding MarR family transcriptional regulator
MHPVTPNSPDQTAALELLFHLYLFGRKIKQQVKQTNSEHVHDRMLEFGILRLISQAPKSVSELAVLLSTGLSAMSERVKAMKEKDLIDQVSASDGREMRCQLTEAGQTLINQTKTKMIKTCLEFTQALNPTELVQLNQLMKKLVSTPQVDQTELQ